MKSPKPKPCKQCGTEFVPRNSLQKVCSGGCALRAARLDEKLMLRVADRASKLQRAKMREWRRVTREKLTTRREWLKRAQVAFNAYIRARDAGLPCISCGTTQAKWDAGHYRSVGACPELRFNELNVWKQCAACNTHRSGNAIEYRIGLVKRIGADRVAELEGPHPPLKLTVPEIRAIEADYKARVKAMTRRAA